MLISYANVCVNVHVIITNVHVIILVGHCYVNVCVVILFILLLFTNMLCFIEFTENSKKRKFVTNAIYCVISRFGTN